MANKKAHGDNYYAAIFLGIIVAIAGVVFLAQGYLTSEKKETSMVKEPEKEKEKKFDRYAKETVDVPESISTAAVAPKPSENKPTPVRSSALARPSDDIEMNESALEEQQAQGILAEPLNRYVEEVSDAELFLQTIRDIAQGRIVDDLQQKNERVGAKQQISSINFYASRSSKKISYSFASHSSHFRASFNGRQVASPHVLVTLVAQNSGKNIKTVFVKTIPEGRRSNILLSPNSPLTSGPYEVRVYELSQHVPLVAQGEFLVK